MVALLQRLGIVSTAPEQSAAAKRNATAAFESHDKDTLTQDQIAYLHELAEERRRAWMAQKNAS
jgi:hypothetical protein